MLLATNDEFIASVATVERELNGRPLKFDGGEGRNMFLAVHHSSRTILFTSGDA